MFSLPLDIALVHRSSDEDFNKALGENLDEFTAMSVKLLRERAQAQQSPFHSYIEVACHVTPPTMRTHQFCSKQEAAVHKHAVLRIARSVFCC